MWNDSPASEVRRARKDAGGESADKSEAGYQNEASLDGAFTCQRDPRIWLATMEAALTSAGLRIPNLCRLGHSNLPVVWIFSEEESIIGNNEAD